MSSTKRKRRRSKGRIDISEFGEEDSKTGVTSSKHKNHKSNSVGREHIDGEQRKTELKDRAKAQLINIDGDDSKNGS